MSLRFTLTILCVLFAANVFAQVPVVDKDVEDSGYSTFPVLQCPATNEALKDFRKKLLDLKKAIKDEASNCKGIPADVAGLSELVTNQRDEIVGLIAKGQSEGLTEQERGKVESYVQKLTEKTSNLVSVLTGSDACFDEDKKGMSLEFITSLIGEGSKILSIVGGPEVGATVQVASEVITGFLKAMKTIQENRQGYKFYIADQKMAYAGSLCSLFDYRRELNKLIAPYESVERLHELSSVLKKQIEVLRANCPECREIIQAVEEISNQARQSKNPEEIRMDDIWPKPFETSMAAKAREIDKLYTRRLGTHTYRSLKTISWIPLRIRSLEDSSLKADLGLNEIVKEMASIEKFMVTEQAPLFMGQLVKDGRQWKKQLESHITSASYTINMLRMAYPKIVWPKISYWSSTTEEYYGQILESLDIAREFVKPSDRALIKTYFADLESMARNLNISYDVVNNYCTFFDNANWYRNSSNPFNPTGIHQVCGGPAIDELRGAALMFTNYKRLMALGSGELLDAPPLPAVVAEPVVTQDWVESLTRVVDDMTSHGDYVTRQQPPINPG